jgi:Family of unknown function (DUF6092)
MFVMTEDEALELLAFLVTAARTQVDEPPEYAPLRLLTAAQRPGEAVIERVSPGTRRLLSGPLRHIAAVETPSADADDYTTKLDAMCAAIAQRLVAHFGKGGGGQ